MVGLNMTSGPLIGILPNVKQMSCNVKSADMKYQATMAQNERVPLTQKRKINY